MSGTASPDEVRGQLIDLALKQPELSPRELAVTFTHERAYFVSEASVYRLLRAHGLITSPAFAVMKAADEFHDKTTLMKREAIEQRTFDQRRLQHARRAA